MSARPAERASASCIEPPINPALPIATRSTNGEYAPAAIWTPAPTISRSDGTGTGTPISLSSMTAKIASNPEPAPRAVRSTRADATNSTGRWMNISEVTSAGIAAIVALALVLVVGAYLFAPAYLRGTRRELTRSESLAAVASSLGLAFSANDPAFPGATPLHFPFELFSRGERQLCENVMAGELDGVGVRAFDF